MATTTDLEKLVINYLTQDQYDDAREAGTLNANELYLTPDTGSTNGTVTSVATGGGLTGGPITTSGTISHADTSSQSSVSNSGRTYIQSITLDTYGHVTGLSSATETVTNSDEKLGTDAVTSGTTYYIVAGTNTTGAERKKYDASGIAYKATNGTANGTNGEALLTLGNSTASTSANWKAGKIFLYSSSAYGGTLVPEAVTSSSKTWTLPNKTGTIALTSDIPDTSSFITVDEKLKWTASTTSSTYYPIQSTSTAATSTANTLNGISFYQYYNTAGGYRRLDLGNATAWKSTGGAYGTIRLYGAAATYYGDLIPGVLGTTSGDGHLTANRTWTFPNASGIVALGSGTTGYLVKWSDANTLTNGPQIGSGTTKFLREDGTWQVPAYIADTNTTYTLTNALSSHKFTWTFTAGGSGSGSTTTFAEFAAGTGISLTDDTSNSNKKITINHSNSVTAKSTQAVYPITFDAQGHITGSGTAVTIPTVPGIATNTTAGLVKPWYYWQQSSTGPTAGTVNSSATVNARSATAGRYYPIEMDKDGRMFVNVPWSAGGDLPSTTGSSTTGITVSAHSTGAVRGVKTGTNSTTTASKASGGNGSAPSLTVTSTTVANSITGAIDSSDSTMLVISLGTTSVGSASGWSAGSASTWSFTDVTVPIRADNDSTFVTSTTHTVTDPGHTHSI